MSSEKRKHDQLSEEELEERENVAADFFSLAVKIRAAEKRLKKMREDKKALLVQYPYLSNAVGSLHKGGSTASAPGSKKPKRTEDTPMEEAAPPKSGFSPKDRISLRIAQKAGETSRALRQETTDRLREEAHDRA